MKKREPCGLAFYVNPRSGSAWREETETYPSDAEELAPAEAAT